MWQSEQVWGSNALYLVLKPGLQKTAVAEKHSLINISENDI